MKIYTWYILFYIELVYSSISFIIDIFEYLFSDIFLVKVVDNAVFLALVHEIYPKIYFYYEWNRAINKFYKIIYNKYIISFKVLDIIGVKHTPVI